MNIETQLFLFLNESISSVSMDVIMGVATQVGTIRIIYPATVLLIYLTDRKHAFMNVLVLSSVLFLEIFIGSIIKDVFARPRPVIGLGELISQGKAVVHMVYLNDHFPFFTAAPPGLKMQDQFGLGIEKGYSFPSGHAQVAFGVATYLSSVVRRRRYSVIFFSIAVLCGLSRIYVGVHYPLDVFVGAILGITIAWLIIRSSHKAVMANIPNILSTHGPTT